MARSGHIGGWRRGAALAVAAYFGALQADIHGLHTCGRSSHVSHSGGCHSGTCHVSSNGDTRHAGSAHIRGCHQDSSGICLACLFLKGNNSAAPQAPVVIASLVADGHFSVSPEEVTIPREKHRPQVPRAPPCVV